MRIELVSFVAALILGGCGFQGLPTPPVENFREELTLSPPTDEIPCEDVGMYGVAPAPHLLEEGRPCNRETEAFCFRMAPEFRAVAAAHDPVAALARSAEAFDANAATGDETLLERANAFADLSVSGRRSYLAFSAAPPSLEMLDSVASDRAIAQALERAYRVAWALRGSPAERAEMRPALGWVAVSPEDDLPDRPVNISSSAFPQTDLEIDVPLADGTPRRVRTRVLLASTLVPPAPETPANLVGAIPPAVPFVVPETGDVLVLVHGHTSLAEEGAGYAAALVSEYAQRGRDVSIFAMDHPSNGYAERVDPREIVDAANGADNAILEFLDAFLIAFVERLDRERPGTSDRIAAVLGGSLGGNLAFRLAERGAELPWVRRLVVWSPASIDYSWARASIASTSSDTYSDLVKYQAVRLTRYESEQPESTGARAAYFAGSLMGLRTQASYWYRDGWACKSIYIDEGLVQIGETYDEYLRRWHYRTAYEQLVFSHIEPPEGGIEPRFSTITVPLLLVTGEADNGLPVSTFDFVRRLAPHLTMGGQTLFLTNTGHALHTERPVLLSQETMRFLFDEEGS